MSSRGYRPEEIAEKTRASRREVVLFNMPARNWGACERDITGLPERDLEFREGVERYLSTRINWAGRDFMPWQRGLERGTTRLPAASL